MVFVCLLYCKGRYSGSVADIAAEGDRTMKWTREKDYRGYRTYGDESPSRAGGGVVARLLARIKAGLKASIRPTASTVLVSKGERQGFSTLGTQSGLSRPEDCPFPSAPAKVTPANNQ